jgi:hypothetical protein
MGNPPISYDKQWKRANRKFLKELTDYVDYLEQSDISDEIKKENYEFIQDFINKSIKDIYRILIKNTPKEMADDLRIKMRNNLTDLFYSIDDKIAVVKIRLKPPVEVDITPIASARIMIPDRTTQDTNIKTGGAISGFVGRVREMFQGPEVKSNNPIPVASKLEISDIPVVESDIPVAEAMQLITAIPMRPTGERPSGRSFRADRIPVTNFGGGGGAATEENKDEE